MRTFRRMLPVLLLVAAALHAADASATVQAYNEPTYTKTATNDAFFYHWVAVNGTGGNTTYFLCFNTYDNNVRVESSNGTSGGPGSTNCTGSLRSGATPSSGDFAATPFTPSTVLTDGHRYDLCASGFYWSAVIWYLDGQTTTCAGTIIDRNRPSLSVSLAGGSAYTSQATFPVSLAYQDATSPPWAGAGGVASNWLCSGTSTCTPGGQPVADCSHAANPSSTSTSFSCTATAASDGHWYVCAQAADSAVPDNPSGTNQLANATSNNANLSSVACDDVTLDRVAPAVSASASSVTVDVGQTVTFTGSATDATAGVTAPLSWDFGDGTPTGSGTGPTHAFGQAGTYVVRASVADRAGNLGSGAVTVTVRPAAGGGGGTTTTPGGGTSTTPGGTSTTPGGTSTTPGGTSTTPGGTSTTPGGTSTTPGGTSTTPGGTSTTPGGTTGGSAPSASGAATIVSAPSDATIKGDSGAMPQRLTAGTLRLFAPKRFTRTRTRTTMRLRAVVGGAGTIALTLRRGSKRIARGTLQVRAAGTVGVGLRLPSSTRAGRHALEVRFTPAAGPARTARATIAVRVAKASGRAAPLVGIPLAR